MANQRMYLLCTKCMDDALEDDLDTDKAMLYLGKYYPSSGWYNTNPKMMGRKFDRFMAQHKHGGMTGRYFAIVFDGWFDEMAKTRDGVMNALENLCLKESRQ